jgi:hypothetical protein
MTEPCACITAFGDNVFRCDQFNLIALACQLFINGLSQGWVGVGEIPY